MTEDEFQRFLDAMSGCFLRNDFAAWRAVVHLPLTIVTALGSEEFHSEEALRENFDCYFRAYSIMALDEIYRRPISVELCPDGLILGTYETNLLRRGQRVVDPFKSSLLLHPEGAGYRVSSILNARGHREWTQAHLEAI